MCPWSSYIKCINADDSSRVDLLFTLPSRARRILRVKGKKEKKEQKEKRNGETRTYGFINDDRVEQIANWGISKILQFFVQEKLFALRL